MRYRAIAVAAVCAALVFVTAMHFSELRAYAQCWMNSANCWHCARSMCWMSANSVHYWGDLWSWYCNLSYQLGCGGGECNLHYLEVTSICDGYYYGSWDFICCDIM